MKFYVKYDNKNDLGPICLEMSLSELSYRWLRAKVQYFHRLRTEDSAILY